MRLRPFAMATAPRNASSFSGRSSAPRPPEVDANLGLCEARRDGRPPPKEPREPESEARGNLDFVNALRVGRRP